MTSKIDSLGSVVISLGSAAKASAGQPASTAVASAAPAAPTDKVSLTGAAVRMQQLTETAGDGPQVDAQRVAALKSAIANGSYKVDAGSVASKLSRFEWEMQG
jgi:negative regulator of flagellin synthesis FlgM